MKYIVTQTIYASNEALKFATNPTNPMQARKPAIKQPWLRALLFFIAFYILTMFFAVIGISIAEQFGAPVHLNDSLSVDAFFTDHLGFAAIVSTSAAFIATWLFRKFIDRRSLYSLGFAWRGFENHAWTGFAAAIALMGLGTLVLMLTGYLHFTDVTFNLEAFIFNAIIMVLIAVSEELVMRGYLLKNLMKATNKWVALVITSVLFVVMHLNNPGLGPLPLIELFVAGIMLGVNYIYTKNLWFGIFLHFAWNFMQGPILGYEVSGLKLVPVLQQHLSGPAIWTGGAFGFEGSLLAIILSVLLIVLLVVVYERKGLGRTPAFEHALK